MDTVTPVTEQPPAQPSHTKRNLTIAGIAVLAAAGIAIGVALSSTGGDSFTAHGEIQLTAIQYGDNVNPSSPADGDSCNGIEGYSDIRPGLTITIEGANGQPLATGLLQAGTMRDVANVSGLAEGLCELPFTISVPAGQAQYAVAIANRGAQEYSQSQLQQGVTLTLGVG
jgi:hypothetical protein